MSSEKYTTYSTRAIDAIGELIGLYNRDLLKIEMRVAEGKGFESDQRLIAHMVKRLSELVEAQNLCRLNKKVIG